MIFYGDKVINFCQFIKIADDFLPVTAAGGVVRNADGKYLMIFRNGRWDFPKGHVEQGESVAQAALREVNEECGISGLRLIGGAGITMHTYPNSSGRYELKITYWFLMSYDGNEELVPQTEEGITDIGWFGGKKLMHNLHNSYGSVRSLLKKILKQNI